jgi:hypothetical protein
VWSSRSRRRRRRKRRKRRRYFLVPKFCLLPFRWPRWFSSRMLLLESGFLFWAAAAAVGEADVDDCGRQTEPAWNQH